MHKMYALFAALTIGLLVLLPGTPALADPNAPIVWGSWSCPNLTVTIQNTSSASVTYQVSVGPLGPNTVTVGPGGRATTGFTITVNGLNRITLVNVATGVTTTSGIDQQGSTIVCTVLGSPSAPAANNGAGGNGTRPSAGQASVSPPPAAGAMGASQLPPQPTPAIVQWLYAIAAVCGTISCAGFAFLGYRHIRTRP